MSNKQLVLSSFLFSVLVAGLPHATAQNQAHDGLPPLMKILDTNKDGILSSTEINAAGQVLKQLDTNGDGLVSAKEVTSVGVPDSNRRLYRYIMKRDANGDGKLSQEELGERFLEMFQQTDKDKDGFLTKTEILKAVDTATSKPVGAVTGEKDSF